jgi:hypothetical protein
MQAMSELLGALARLIRTRVAHLLGDAPPDDVERVLDEVRVRREACEKAASRRALGALSDDDPGGGPVLQWMSYASLLVQVDRMVDDLGTSVTD